MFGDCTLQTILDDGEPDEEDGSCVTIGEDQTFCNNLVAFLISQTCWINLLVCNYSKPFQPFVISQPFEFVVCGG